MLYRLHIALIDEIIEINFDNPINRNDCIDYYGDKYRVIDIVHNISGEYTDLYIGLY